MKKTKFVLFFILLGFVLNVDAGYTEFDEQGFIVNATNTSVAIDGILSGFNHTFVNASDTSQVFLSDQQDITVEKGIYDKRIDWAGTPDHVWFEDISVFLYISGDLIGSYDLPWVQRARVSNISRYSYNSGLLDGQSPSYYLDDTNESSRVDTLYNTMDNVHLNQSKFNQSISSIWTAINSNASKLNAANSSIESNKDVWAKDTNESLRVDALYNTMDDVHMNQSKFNQSIGSIWGAMNSNASKLDAVNSSIESNKALWAQDTNYWIQNLSWLNPNMSISGNVVIPGYINASIMATPVLDAKTNLTINLKEKGTILFNASNTKYDILLDFGKSWAYGPTLFLRNEGTLRINSNVLLEDNKKFLLGANSASMIWINTSGGPYLKVLRISTSVSGDYQQSGYIFFDRFSDHRKAYHNVSDPHVLIWAAGPDPTDWLEFYHDKTNGYVATGSGNITLNASEIVSSLSSIISTGDINASGVICDKNGCVGDGNSTKEIIDAVNGTDLNFTVTRWGSQCIYNNGTQTAFYGNCPV